MDAQKYMLHCLELAQKASDEDEVPIGAAVVDPESGEIVSEAYNLSEHKLDATAHAETLGYSPRLRKTRREQAARTGPVCDAGTLHNVRGGDFNGADKNPLLRRL